MVERASQIDDVTSVEDLLSQGRFEEVLERCSSIVESGGSLSPPLLRSKGISLRRLGRAEEAIGVLQEAIDLTPEPRAASDLRVELGDALLDVGKLLEAIEQLCASAAAAPGTFTD